MPKRKNKPQTQTASNKPPQQESEEKLQQEQETTQEVQSEPQPEVDIAELVGSAVHSAVEERLKSLDELVSKLVGQNINYEEITTSVLQHVEANKPEGGEAPKWHRLDPEKCYQQCLDRALHIVTMGQTQVYMSQTKNCKMLMKQVINLANTMFEALAEEFQIAS